jgi:hypothetical protein
VKKGSRVRTVFLVLLAASLLAPVAALAQRWPGGPVGSRGFTRPFAPHPIGPRPFFSHPFHRPFFDRSFFHHPFFHHPFFHHPFFHGFAFGGIASPVIVYASPPVLYGLPASVDPPAVYSPPVYPAAPVYDPSVARTVSISPPPPPMPNVVEYPTGRYELRGDGMTTSYTWVWVPNPPPAPPPESASVGPASPGPSTSGGSAPAHHSQLFRWTDAQGVEYWTDRWETVPEQYRAKARQPRLS